jgi:tetratricopeptide (TPR) repeat protein
MHREIVEVTAELIQMMPIEDIGEEQWDFAYFSHELGRLEEAEQAYQSYLGRNPQSASALNNLAVILETKGLFQQALTLLEQALILYACSASAGRGGRTSV